MAIAIVCKEDSGDLTGSKTLLSRVKALTGFTCKDIFVSAYNLSGDNDQHPQVSAYENWRTNGMSILPVVVEDYCKKIIDRIIQIPRKPPVLFV